MLFGGGVGAGGGGGMKQVTHAVCGCCDGSPGGVGSLGSCAGPGPKMGIVGSTTGGHTADPTGSSGGPLGPGIGSPTPTGAPARIGALPCSGPAPSNGPPPCNGPVPSRGPKPSPSALTFCREPPSSPVP